MLDCDRNDLQWWLLRHRVSAYRMFPVSMRLSVTHNAPFETTQFSAFLSLIQTFNMQRGSICRSQTHRSGRRNRKTRLRTRSSFFSGTCEIHSSAFTDPSALRDDLRRSNVDHNVGQPTRDTLRRYIRA